MSKLGKFIGGAALGALAASLIPYRFQRDKETGAFELGALLWGLKKTPGEEQDTYTVELLPFLKSEEPDEAEDEDVFDFPSAEKVADKVAEAVEEAAETAEEAVEEAAEELG